MADGAKVAELAFPPEWRTAEWMLAEVVAQGKAADGSTMLLAGGVLRDGSNLMGLTFPGGVRMLRTSPVTGWSIEERFKGRPRQVDEAAVEQVWRLALDSVIAAKHDAEEGPCGCGSDRAWKECCGV